MAVEVITFGDFDILNDGWSVLKKTKRTNKNLELLKFFITYRNKKLVSENIIESIWPGMDFADSKNALRTQIFRLRRNLEEMGFMRNGQHSRNFDIVFENGFYVFNPGDCCTIDSDRFEDNIKKADYLRREEPDKAIDIYREIIDIYKGEYLAENLYSEWIFIIRSRYHRLFIQSVLRLLELLKAKRQYVDIIDIYERTVAFEPFEESFQIYFLESLLELKEYKNALSHYNYITGKMYREMSINPTPALKRIYRRITSAGEYNQEKDIMQIGQKMADDDRIDGALFCDLDYFKAIYNLERRKTLRSGNTEFLGLICVVHDKENRSGKYKDTVSTALENVLSQSLRKGDVFAWWNPYQMVVMLTDVCEENLTLISKRIEENFRGEIFPNKISIRISFQPVGAKESFIK